NLTRCFTSQPLSRNSTASQSSSSGCVGQAPCEPKSSSVLTRPWPKNSFHSPLTNTRAVSGLSAPGIHLARSSRVARRLPPPSPPPLEGGDDRGGDSDAGTVGATISPESSSQLPRGSTRITRGATDSEIRVEGTAFKRVFFWPWSSASFLRNGSSG